MVNNIKKILHDYSKLHREDFNKKLFMRSELAIIDCIKMIINSITGTDSTGNIKLFVNYFRVIDDYKETLDILRDLESPDKRKNKRIEYNEYDYIRLKKSDIIMLEVNYHIEANNTSRDDSVYIDIPRVMDKYYFRISGILYSTLYQIADASTYSNSSSKCKDEGVNFRQEFPKSTVYKKFATINQYITNDDGTTSEVEVKCCNFTIEIFANQVSVCKYILAQIGYDNVFDYLHIDKDAIKISYEPENRTDYIVFKKNAVFISVPYYYWNNSLVVQSLIYTIYSCIPKDNNFEVIHDIDYWICILGGDFKSRTKEKGLSILDSTRRNYSVIMKNTLRLPDDDKDSLINIMRWEIFQFDDLYKKDNYDITYKKIRLPEYIAGFYAAKLTYQLLRVGNGSSVTADKLFKQLNINHDFILTSIKRSNLKSYKNSVNDDDIFNVLKFTYKGESGIGDNKASAVPTKYKLANASHIGNVDCDTSSSTDPGMTGLICPYADIQDGGYFSNYKEPCNWREVQDSLIRDYRSIYSTKSIFKTRAELLGTKQGIEYIDFIERAARKLIPFVNKDIEYHIDDDEII